MNGKERTITQRDLHDPRVRVLVADDDCDLRCLLADVLESAGYQAIPTSNGLEALYAFEVQRPDLAVIDLDMPVMSGYRLLHLLRRRGGTDRRQVPVIVISNSDPQETMDIVVETRPEAYLQKPFVADRFIEQVAGLLTHFQPEQTQLTRDRRQGAARRATSSAEVA